MNLSMWRKALTVIPEVTKEEWDRLDLVSRWLISTRAAVLLMTFLSAVLAGVFAIRDGYRISLWAWAVLILGLVLAHAANNLFNDYTDYARGVDRDNYYRTQYGPQPIASGLMTRRQHLTYFVVTGLLALVCGLVLLAWRKWDPFIWILLGLGAFFVLFYTWPLKYLALGELAVFVVWGPLMIGGGYYVLTGRWDWLVVLASMPYTLGVTTVLLGKHIDKLAMDKEKRIYTLPVVIGEKAARYLMLGMMVLSYVLVIGMVIAGVFTPVMLAVVLALPTLRKLYPMMLKPKPETCPPGFPQGQGGWPLYFAPIAFVNNRAFGTWFLLGLLVDTALKVFVTG